MNNFIDIKGYIIKVESILDVQYNDAEVMKFCHRHIAAEWLSNGTDYDIMEFDI